MEARTTTCTTNRENKKYIGLTASGKRKTV
jgi:hypothetical protein